MPAGVTGMAVWLRSSMNLALRRATRIMSKLSRKSGQRVSRGNDSVIWAASGRYRRPFHYEVRVGGKAVNPMIYIKAAKDIF